ncbi:DUF1127 domain-containing protein [Acuticoccus kandeliae]|uniref:DUF1127 domain-containing protein n=1 Tax=Acuticoccus kandeliae TaxID=2073160 RepID=UPI000D3E8D94|nr:DUF1127 domain-containing protein [Acuticoccus kandeliae]
MTNTIFNAPASERAVPSDFASRMMFMVKTGFGRLWHAHVVARDMAYLRSRSDYELKDIGLTRENIERAVRGEFVPQDELGRRY